MIVLAATYHVQPGKGDNVAEALKRMAPLVKAEEPGCLLYHANRSSDNPDHFLLYEIYADQAALEQHRATTHFREIIEGEVVPMLDKRERQFYEQVVG